VLTANYSGDDMQRKPVVIKFKKLHPDAQIPKYLSKGAAGADIHAIVGGMGVRLKPDEMVTIPTGLAVEIPQGYEIQVRSRSGLALGGISVVNSPGTIDSDYRGEISVILCNHGPRMFEIHNKTRIAQLVLAKVDQIEWAEVSELSSTVRDINGLGSTGND
jgi:dUTP pyrophosphatase